MSEVHAPRIVLTGGPGGGKTTAADLFRREIGERVVVVPEAATIMFRGGFPRRTEPLARRAVQTAIFHLQRNLENVQAAAYPARVLLCDRGTVDGGAYWPAGGSDFFTEMGTSCQLELKRYDAVVFFETAARGGHAIGGGSPIEGGNPTRTEDQNTALALDDALRQLWEQHPRFHLVPHSSSFLEKITKGLAVLQSLVGQLAP